VRFFARAAERIRATRIATNYWPFREQIANMANSAEEMQTQYLSLETSKLGQNVQEEDMSNLTAPAIRSENQREHRSITVTLVPVEKTLEDECHFLRPMERVNEVGKHSRKTCHFIFLLRI